MTGNKKRENNPDLLSSNFLSVTINVCLILIVFSIINNLIFDLVSTFIAYHKIKKLSSIKIKETNYLELRLNDIQLQDIFNEKNYFLIFIIFNIFHASFAFLYSLGYIDTNIKRNNHFLNIKFFFAYLLKNYFFIILLSLIIFMFFLTKSKKLLSNSSYYNKDLFANKLFNIHSNRAMYFINILNYQFIIELLLSIPIILFLLLEIINIISLTILFISIFFYIYLGSTLYIAIDENNNVEEVPISNILKKLLCFNNKTIYLRNKNIKDIFNDFMYHYDINETNKIKNIELTLFNNNNLDNNNPYIHPLQTNGDKYFNSSRKLFEINPSLINRNIITNKRNNIDFEKNTIKTIIDFKNICDYYILYKLLYLYFQENRDVYNYIARKMNDDTNMFKRKLVESSTSRRKSSIGNNSSIIKNNYKINKQDFINNVERIVLHSIFTKLFDISYYYLKIIFL